MAFGSVNVPGDLSGKQDKLTGLPGQVVGFDTAGAAAAVQWLSNENLLRNWYFAGGGSQLGNRKLPINQMGKTAYAPGGTAVYSIDRWKVNRVTLELSEDGVILSNPTSSAYGGYIGQLVEHSRIPHGSTVTLSCIVDEELYYTTINNVNPSIGAKSIYFNDRKCRFVLEPTSTDYSFGVYNMVPDTSVTYKAVKLELGPVQTLAHQNEDGKWVLNDQPDYDLQYALCSQYNYITGEWVGYQRSNENLVRNWYFVDPINQRGKTEYGGVGYNIDGWVSNNANNVFVVGDSFEISLKATSKFYQLIELLPAGTYTLSFLFSSRSGSGLAFYTPLGAYTPGTKTITTESGVLMTCTFTIPEDKARTPIGLTGNGVNPADMSYGTIIAAKLEVGACQTLCCQDAEGNFVLNDTPDKALELLKCQRYQRKVTFSAVRATGRNIRDNTITFAVPADLSNMRATPAITLHGSQSNGSVSGLAVIPGGNSLSTWAVSTGTTYTARIGINRDISIVASIPTETFAVNGSDYTLMSGSDAYIFLDANL